jgi:hypothetical protein
MRSWLWQDALTGEEAPFVTRWVGVAPLIYHVRSPLRAAFRTFSLIPFARLYADPCEIEVEMAARTESASRGGIIHPSALILALVLVVPTCAAEAQPPASRPRGPLGSDIYLRSRREPISPMGRLSPKVYTPSATSRARML